MDNLHAMRSRWRQETRDAIILPSGKFMINLNKPPSHAVYERMSSVIELE